MTSFSSRSKWRLAVVGGNTHLCLWGAPFISNQQQIALSVNNNLFLESATCHTHKKSRYTRKTDREEDRQTWASLAENYTLGCCPAGHCERLGGGLGPAASHQWGCKRTSELRLRCAFENRARPGQNAASRATPGEPGPRGGFSCRLCVRIVAHREPRAHGVQKQRTPELSFSGCLRNGIEFFVPARCRGCRQIGGLRTRILLKRNPVLGGHRRHRGGASAVTGGGGGMLHYYTGSHRAGQLADAGR